MIRKGAIPKPKRILGVRPLTRDDLRLLEEKRETNVAKRLRDPHHNLARLIAAGNRDAHILAGYSYGRMAQLQKDPTFLNLVEHYRGVVNETFKDNRDEYHELLFSNQVKAERQIAEKLEAADEEGELLPTRDLIAIARDGADRTGYGKKQTNLNVNVDFAAQLERAITRSGKVLELRPTLPGPQVGALDSSSSVASGAPTAIRRRA